VRRGARVRIVSLDTQRFVGARAVLREQGCYELPSLGSLIVEELILAFSPARDIDILIVAFAIDIGAAGTPNLIPVVFDATTFPDTVLGPLVGQQVEAEVTLGPSAADPSATVLTLVAIKSEDMCQAEDDQGDDNGGGSGDGLRARDHGDGCEDDD